MAKQIDEIADFKGLHNCDCRIQVQVFDDLIFPGRSIVIFTEPNDNPGTSVTNGIEMFVRDACSRYKLNPFNITIIEHYLNRQFASGGDIAETFDVVTFGYVDTADMPRRPTWRPAKWPAINRQISPDEIVKWADL
jgi:hypothetical protein